MMYQVLFNCIFFLTVMRVGRFINVLNEERRRGDGLIYHIIRLTTMSHDNGVAAQVTVK